MTPEERDRLAKLEERTDYLQAEVGQMNGKLDKLLEIANVGKGQGIAFRTILQWGSFGIAAAGGMSALLAVLGKH
ncbi:MAG TPA: hypothetical protein VKY65_17870 [Alphaproteobacteria bacterium]|nr:hypothetical protein [Alphaproteobacteria bacterium]